MLYKLERCQKHSSLFLKGLLRRRVKVYNFDSLPFGRLRVARIPHFQIQSPYGVASAPSLKPDQAESAKRVSLFCVEFTDEERMFDDVTKVD